jgi:transposase-like protein
MDPAFQSSVPNAIVPTYPETGRKYNGKQNYRCTQYGRQFIGDYQMTYRGCLSRVVLTVKIMLVRGIGMRDISTVHGISVTKVLKALKSGKYQTKCFL